MRCAKCKYSDSKVVSSDHNDLKNVIQRRRECLRCGTRFTTHEKPREIKPLQDDRYLMKDRK